MNIYDRIINILLEARVEMFIQDRLDEGEVKARNKAMKRALTKRTRDQEAPPAGRSGRIGLSPGERDAAGDHEVRMAGAGRTPTDDSEAVAVGRRNLKLPRKDTFRADEARYESGKKVGPGPKQGRMSKEVISAIRQRRFEDATGISPAESEAARQKRHAETHGRGAPGRAIRARGRRQVDNP